MLRRNRPGNRWRAMSAFQNDRPTCRAKRNRRQSGHQFRTASDADQCLDTNEDFFFCHRVVPNRGWIHGIQQGSRRAQPRSNRYSWGCQEPGPRSISLRIGRRSSPSGSPVETRATQCRSTTSRGLIGGGKAGGHQRAHARSRRKRGG